MKNIFLTFFIGILAGVVNGMFSTGAGLILIPGLIYAMNIPQLQARGTALVIIESLCITNLIIYSHSFSFEAKYIYIILGGMLGSIVGSKIVYKIKNIWLNIGFAIFTIIMGIGMM